VEQRFLPFHLLAITDDMTCTLEMYTVVSRENEGQAV
jgi:hypothetical protein